MKSGRFRPFRLLSKTFHSPNSSVAQPQPYLPTSCPHNEVCFHLCLKANYAVEFQMHLYALDTHTHYLIHSINLEVWHRESSD